MLSHYFKMKTVTDEFGADIKALIQELSGKNVLIYGAGDSFIELNKRYDFAQYFNIVGIADKTFDKFDSQTNFKGFRAIKRSEIVEQDFDYILITNETNKKIFRYLAEELSISEKKIKTIFKAKFNDEAININELEKYNFAGYLKKLKKKLKNKSVVIYGAGAFFQLIQHYYDLSGLNIIGISDKKFEEHEEDEVCLGYKVYSPTELRELNPDYVLVATKMYISIIEILYYDTLKNSKIKIKPIYKKPFLVLLREIWC